MRLLGHFVLQEEEMRQRNMTKGLLVIAFLFLAAGCKEKEGGNEVTPPVGASVVPQPTGTDIEGENGRPPAADDGRKEAKMLQDLVAAKKLPPLENRIPAADDVMTEPLGTVGVYGESAQLAAADAGVMAGELVSEGLFCYAADGSIVPNIAKGYTVNADFTRYTISLREGMRWSDGVPFTSDDCVFFYEHMCVPKTFGESLWKCFLSYDAGGNASPAVFTKIDNTSFQVTFSSPKPDFLEELLEQGGICFAPEHYHVNLLPEYMGEDAALAKAKSMGYTDTAAMLRAAVLNAWNIANLPTLNPFCLSTKAGANDVNGAYYEFVRNPYYWKVDADGKQLPYLDRLEFTRISGAEQSLLLTTEGYLTVGSLTAEQVAEAEAEKERGGYHVVAWSELWYWAVDNSLGNFPETASYEAKVRGFGAAHAEGWYFK